MRRLQYRPALRFYLHDIRVAWTTAMGAHSTNGGAASPKWVIVVPWQPGYTPPMSTIDHAVRHWQAR